MNLKTLQKNHGKQGKLGKHVPGIQVPGHPTLITLKNLEPCRLIFFLFLNLAEGADKISLKDRVRFYNIALGSLREVQSVIQLEELKHLEQKADYLGACLYKLVNQ